MKIPPRTYVPGRLRFGVGTGAACTDTIGQRLRRGAAPDVVNSPRCPPGARQCGVRPLPPGSPHNIVMNGSAVSQLEDLGVGVVSSMRSAMLWDVGKAQQKCAAACGLAG